MVRRDLTDPCKANQQDRYACDELLIAEAKGESIQDSRPEAP